MPDLAFGDCEGCECVCVCVLLGGRVHMDQDGGAFWRPPGRVWVCVRDRRGGGLHNVRFCSRTLAGSGAATTAVRSPGGGTEKAPFSQTDPALLSPKQLL